MIYIFKNEDFRLITDLHDVPAMLVLHAFAERHPEKVKISESDGLDYCIRVSVTGAETQRRFNTTVLNPGFDWMTRMRRVHQVSKRREQIAIETALLDFPYHIKMPRPQNKEKLLILMARTIKLLGNPDLLGSWYMYQDRAYFKRSDSAMTFDLISPG